MKEMNNVMRTPLLNLMKWFWQILTS